MSYDNEYTIRQMAAALDYYENAKRQALNDLEKEQYEEKKKLFDETIDRLEKQMVELKAWSKENV